jgi:hypothetical protein
LRRTGQGSGRLGSPLAPRAHVVGRAEAGAKSAAAAACAAAGTTAVGPREATSRENASVVRAPYERWPTAESTPFSVYRVDDIEWPTMRARRRGKEAGQAYLAAAGGCYSFTFSPAALRGPSRSARCHGPEPLFPWRLRSVCQSTWRTPQVFDRPTCQRSPRPCRVAPISSLPLPPRAWQLTHAFSPRTPHEPGFNRPDIARFPSA